MEKIGLAVLSVLLVVIGLMALIVLGTFTGAVVGWIVGLFFGATILGVMGQFGITGVTMWQLGAFLGFVGGFFKSVNNTKAS